MVSFDNKSLFVFAENFHYVPRVYSNIREDRTRDDLYTTYYQISKLDGEILDSIRLISNEVELNIPSRSGSWSMMNYYQLVKGIDGFFLCNPETDTVFYYTGDKSLTPVLHKIPLASNQDPKEVLMNVVDAGRYLFFHVHTIIDAHADLCFKYYFQEKETGEIFGQKLILPDFMGKEFRIVAGSSMRDMGDANGYVFELGLYELKEAYRENKLSGKLQELVATLDEDKDNNVFMLVNFTN